MSIEDIIQDLFCTVLFQCLKTALSVVIKCDNMEEQTGHRVLPGYHRTRCLLHYIDFGQL